MTIGEVAERIQAAYSRGVSSDDVRLSYRIIYNKMVTVKAVLLSQIMNKGQKVSDRNMDFIECVPLEKAEPYECPCAPPSGCLILKSKCKLPRPVSNKNGDYITSVSSIDGFTFYDRTTWEGKKSKQHSKYTGTKPDYFFKNDYIYITTKDLLLKAVTVSGIFDDITKYDCSFCDECDNDLITDDCTAIVDKEFKIESRLLDPLVDLAVAELIGKWKSDKEDERNDAREDKEEQRVK